MEPLAAAPAKCHRAKTHPSHSSGNEDRLWANTRGSPLIQPIHRRSRQVVMWLRGSDSTACPCPRERKAGVETYPDAIVSILMSCETKLQECEVREGIRNARKCLLVSSYEQGLKLLRNTDQFIHHVGIVGEGECEMNRLPLIHHGDRSRTARPRGACSRRLLACPLVCGENVKRRAWKIEAENLFMGKQGCGSQLLIDKAATRVSRCCSRGRSSKILEISSLVGVIVWLGSAFSC